jgi:hypothetical protein
MSRNYCQAAASVVSALTIVAAQNRQSVTFKSAASIHKLVTTSSDPSCRCRIRSCDMFGGKQRAAMLALIIAAMLYSTLLYVCGRYTARYAAQRGRSKTPWFVLGSLFYPLPYIALALLPAHGKVKTG